MDKTQTPTAPSKSDIGALRELARWMDEAFEIPGLRYRIGLDGIIGLVPGFGDIFGALVSTWIIIAALRLQAPMPVLTRMVINVLTEVAIGVVPIAGDLFDFAWKANRKNIRLLERHLANPIETRRRSVGFIVAFAGGLILILVIAAVLAVLALRSLVAWMVSVI